MSNFSVAVFGASGAIGQAVCNWYCSRNSDVIGIGRNSPAKANVSSAAKWISWQGGEDVESLFALGGHQLNAVVWTQGANFSDDILSFDLNAHQEMYAANVSYILLSLQALLKGNLLAPSARLCIVSSIWQHIARQHKLSYCVTKSALQGLVQSLSVDLGPSGYMVNAVLPGPLDTPMTRANLSSDQLRHFEESAPLQTLPSLDDVCNLVGFLCSDDNTGITGQFVAADRGYSHARFI